METEFIAQVPDRELVFRESSFQLIGRGIDVQPLLSSILNQKEDLWKQITARQTTPGTAHADTETIFLRWAREQTLHAVFNDLHAVDYPAMQALPEARALIEYILRAVGATVLGRAIIVSLTPGGYITPHIDEGVYADTYERFHLVLTSDLGNSFLVRNDDQHSECVAMRPGEIWWFNHKKEHSVENASNAERIHLIVDCIAPKYRRERN